MSEKELRVEIKRRDAVVRNKLYRTTIYILSVFLYPYIAGNFRVVQIFLKLGETPTNWCLVFHMQSLWWVWFLGIET